MNPRVRVLVVDDSAFARKVLRDVLGRVPSIEVVDVARDGLEALEKIAIHRPDVITLDLLMPGLDGLGVLRALPSDDAPRAVVVSVSDADSDVAVEALQCGAFDLVHKPTALATNRLYEVDAELVAKILAAAAARPRRGRPAPPPVPPPARPSGGVGVVVIGTSTGGPQALTQLFAALPADLAAPVVVALHIPSGYTDALARRLDAASPLHVVESTDGLALTPGVAVIARGGSHLEIERRAGGPSVSFARGHVESLYCPSVDLLFHSAARTFGGAVLGVVLTGMGDDGLAGARAIHAAGGALLVEAESSCIVYGMPRCVREAGLAIGEAPIERMAAEIVRIVGRREAAATAR